MASKVRRACRRCGTEFEVVKVGAELATICGECVGQTENDEIERRAEARRKWLAARLAFIDGGEWDDVPFWRAINCPPVFHFASLRELGRDFEREAAKWSADAMRSILTIWGERGVGKTRALWAIAYYETREQAKRAARAAADDIRGPADAIDWARVALGAFRFERITDLVISIQGMVADGMSAVEKRLRELAEFPGVLLLDDLGAEKTTPFVEQCLYSVICRREEWVRRTAITTNLSLDQVAEQLGDRIASRISGHVVRFTGKDRRLAE